MADHVSKMRRFAAELTLQCHFSSCCSFYLGLDFLLELSQNQAPHSSRPSTFGKVRLLHPFASAFCILCGSAGRATCFRVVLRYDLAHRSPLAPPSGPCLWYGFRTCSAYQ